MIEVSGLDKMKKRLDDLAQRARALDGDNVVPVEELLTPTFLNASSRFTSLNDMFAASAFKIENQADFEAIPADEWDAFINENTSYATWKEMLTDAAKDWTAKRLGF